MASTAQKALAKFLANKNGGNSGSSSKATPTPSKAKTAKEKLAEFKRAKNSPVTEDVEETEETPVKQGRGAALAAWRAAQAAKKDGKGSKAKVPSKATAKPQDDSEDDSEDSDSDDVIDVVRLPKEMVKKFLKANSVMDSDPGERYTSGYPAIDDIFDDGMGNLGLMAGVYLLVGDPGSGKSSFALQMMNSMHDQGHTFQAYMAYEGKNNIYSCMRRIGIAEGKIAIFDDKQYPATSDNFCQLLKDVAEANDSGKPAIFCVDSIKNLDATLGSIVGRRNAIKKLVKVVEKTNSIVFLVGHVSKETRGKKNKKIQGPSELEELCDVRIDFVDVTPKDMKSQGFRHMMLDTTSKNRHGKPGEWIGYELRNDGFTIPPFNEQYTPDIE